MDLDDVEALAVRTFGGADTIDRQRPAGTARPDRRRRPQRERRRRRRGRPTPSSSTARTAPTRSRVSRSGAQARVTGLAAATRVTGSEAALDTLRVQTLAGDDEVTVASNLSDLIGLAFDLGADD